MTMINDMNPADAIKDSAQMHLDNFTCAYFVGPTAPLRLAKFVKEYVVSFTYNGDLNIASQVNDPAKYSQDAVGLPSVCLHTIYESAGIWYLYFQHTNKYQVALNDGDAGFPFNKIPNSSEAGQV